MTKKTDAEWREQLTPDEFRIMRQKGTERAFTGEYWDTKTKGKYTCRGCGETLFSSEHKYDSGSGWPSFDRPESEDAVISEEDNTLGMRRVEVMCANCEAHLGHVFPDGPRETTGTRFCINSASLKLDEEE